MIAWNGIISSAAAAAGTSASGVAEAVQDRVDDAAVARTSEMLRASPIMSAAGKQRPASLRQYAVVVPPRRKSSEQARRRARRRKKTRRELVEAPPEPQRAVDVGGHRAEQRQEDQRRRARSALRGRRRIRLRRSTVCALRMHDRPANPERRARDEHPRRSRNPDANGGAPPASWRYRPETGWSGRTRCRSSPRRRSSRRRKSRRRPGRARAAAGQARAG